MSAEQMQIYINHQRAPPKLPIVSSLEPFSTNNLNTDLGAVLSMSSNRPLRLQRSGCLLFAPCETVSERIKKIVQIYRPKIIEE